LDRTDVWLLVGVKEAQLLVLQRELCALQARVESDRVKANQGQGDA
jgi:hypothetical protein